jgi:hypothetical protein
MWARFYSPFIGWLVALDRNVGAAIQVPEPAGPVGVGKSYRIAICNIRDPRNVLPARKLGKASAEAAGDVGLGAVVGGGSEHVLGPVHLDQPAVALAVVVDLSREERRPV